MVSSCRTHTIHDDGTLRHESCDIVKFKAVNIRATVREGDVIEQRVLVSWFHDDGMREEDVPESSSMLY